MNHTILILGFLCTVLLSKAEIQQPPTLTTFDVEVTVSKAASGVIVIIQGKSNNSLITEATLTITNPEGVIIVNKLVDLPCNETFEFLELPIGVYEVTFSKDDQLFQTSFSSD